MYSNDVSNISFIIISSCLLFFILTVTLSPILWPHGVIFNFLKYELSKYEELQEFGWYKEDLIFEFKNRIEN